MDAVRCAGVGSAGRGRPCRSGKGLRQAQPKEKQETTRPGPQYADQAYLVAPVERDQPHGKGSQHEIDEDQQGRGRAGMAVDLLQNKIVAGGAA